MSSNVAIKRTPLLMLAEVMQQIHDTPISEMAWAHGRIISPTLPSSFLTF